MLAGGESLEEEVGSARRILTLLSRTPHDAKLLAEFRGALKRIRVARRYWRPQRTRSWRAEDLEVSN